jgi:hypothetical protein
MLKYTMPIDFSTLFTAKFEILPYNVCRNDLTTTICLNLCNVDPSTVFHQLKLYIKKVKYFKLFEQC